MTADIQTILAAGIVILAVGFYVYTTYLKKKKAGCDEGCGCGHEKKFPAAKNPD